MTEDPIKNRSEQLDIKIEVAKPEDWQAYKNIWLEALKNNPEAFQSKIENFIDRGDEEWQADLQNPERFFVFAKNDSGELGIKSIASAVDKKDGIWLIARVYTRPDFRGRDLSEKVLNKLLKEIKTRGGSKARLTVRKGPKQEPARDVYRRKLGFYDAEPWDDKLEDTLFMEKDLAS